MKRFRFNGRTNCIEYDGKSILLDSYGEDRVFRMTDYDWGMLIGLISLFILGVIIPYFGSGG